MIPAKQQFRDMKFATLPRIECPRLQTSTSQSAKSLRLQTREASFQSLFNSTTPANVFATHHELLRLPRILQCVEIPAPATRKALWTSKNAPRPSVFNDFDFQIVLARRRGANFAELNFQKCSEHAAWCLFFAEIALARRHGANFPKLNFQKCSGHASL